MCAQQRLRSTWASAQSNQSLRRPHDESWVISYPLIAQRRLIRLGGCTGWSKSLLGAHVIMLVLSCGGSFVIFGDKMVPQKFSIILSILFIYNILLCCVFYFILSILSKQQNIHIVNCYISSASVHVQWPFSEIIVNTTIQYTQQYTLRVQLLSITIGTERQCRCIYCSAIFSTYSPKHSNTCRNLLNLTNCELDCFDFCLRIRIPCLSEGLIPHVRQHKIVWKYIMWTYSGTEEAELWQSRQEWRQIWNVKLQIFCNQGRREVRRWNFPYLAMKADC